MKEPKETPVLQISQDAIPLLLKSERANAGAASSATDAELLTQFYTRLAAWQAQLDALLWNGADVRQMIHTAGEYWHASLTLHDEHYAILARTGDREGIFPLEYNRTIGTEVYASSTVSDWMDDPEFLQSMGTVGAQWWPVKGRMSLYRNLWNTNEIWRGRVILHPGERDFTEIDRQLFECFGHYLEIALEGQSTAHEKINQLLAQMMQEAVAKKVPLKEGVSEILELMGWEAQAPYLCLVLRPTSYEAYSHMRKEALTCSTIEDQVSHSRAIQMGENIAVLVNLAHSRQSVDTIRSSLAYTIRENVLQLGISQQANSFQELPIAYLQACMAIELGWNAKHSAKELPSLSPNSSWSYDFKHYRLSYLLQLVMRDPVGKSITSKTIQILQKYDAETGSDLSETLRIYLEKERSIKQTAAYFSINRTTVTYRLSRIEELTRVNLDSPEERLLLQILFREMQ